jgi:hypothetical protein
MTTPIAAIFNHADAALRNAKKGDTKAVIIQLQKFVLPCLAEIAIANKEVEPGCQQWDTLFAALRDANSPIEID